MHVSIKKLPSGKFRVKTPNEVHAKGTTQEKAKKQANLIRAVSHGWHPTHEDLPPKVFARRLLNESNFLEVECLACDYVEQSLGRRFFAENWIRDPLPVQQVVLMQWMNRNGISENLLNPILAELQRLYLVKARWPK